MMPAVSSDSERPPNKIRCMEVWGGNEAIQDTVSVPGIDVWISVRPFGGRGRGGDVHFISMCGAGRISRFVIADVAGHGASAGALADTLYGLMRRHINQLDQTSFARALNREFLSVDGSSTFASALLATYFAPTDHLIICNAGHPPPLWYHAEERTWELLDHELSLRMETISNLPLGIIEPTDYVQFAVKLEKGDMVVIYTDSLIESRSKDGSPLGALGLLELARSVGVDPPSDLRRRLLAGLAAHRGHAPLQDDETVLVLHHNAANPRRPSLGHSLHMMAKMIGLM